MLIALQIVIKFVQHVFDPEFVALIRKRINQQSITELIPCAFYGFVVGIRMKLLNSCLKKFTRFLPVVSNTYNCRLCFVIISVRPNSFFSHHNISKVHEQTVRGTLAELIQHFKTTAPKGEIVICIGGRGDE